jgi:hypothetical protein
VPGLLRYRIGGASLAVISPDAPLLPEGFSEYLPFLTPGDRAGAADIAIEVRLGLPALPAAARPLMEAGEAWAAHELGGEILIAPRIDPPSARPEWLAAVRADRRRTTLTCGETLLVDDGGQRLLAPPIHYPLDQVLLSLGLAGEALIVHAAGVQIGEGGVLLAGPSGSGKTTIAGICAAAGHAVLSDDRVILRRSPAGWLIYGTPWPGEGGYAENRGVPLAAVIFLAKGGDNALAPLPAAALARRLPPLSSIPWFDPKARALCLDLLDSLAGAVPAHGFVFRPDATAAGALRAAFADPRT